MHRLQDRLEQQESNTQVIPGLRQRIRDLEVELAASKDMTFRLSTNIRDEATDAAKDRDIHWQRLIEEKDDVIHGLRAELHGAHDACEHRVAQKDGEIEKLKAAMENAGSLLYVAARGPST